MRSWIPGIALLILTMASSALAETGDITTKQAPLTAQVVNSTASAQASVSPESQAEKLRSVLLYAEFSGSAFDNYFNQKESLTFLVSAEEGGQLRRRISLDYPEQPREVFIGEITVNQIKPVFTAQAIHNYINPAQSFKFPTLNTNNQELRGVESEKKTMVLDTVPIASSVTIKVIGREGWFSEPNYELQLIANQAVTTKQN